MQNKNKCEKADTHRSIQRQHDNLQFCYDSMDISHDGIQDGFIQCAVGLKQSFFMSVGCIHAHLATHLWLR